MKLGVGPFTGQVSPWDDRSHERLYAEMVDLARTADEVGLDSVWVSEHHFVDDGYISAPLAVLGGLATATSDIEIGSSIVLAPLHDPIRVAEDAAAIDLLSGGRFTLGLGLGYRTEEFEAFGVPRRERAPRMADAVKTIRGALGPGPLDYDPEFHDAGPDVTVTPEPASEVPVVLAGGAPPAVRRAGRLGDGWLALPGESIAGLRARVDDIEAAREEADVDRRFTVYPGARGYVGESREHAWETMKDGYFYTLSKYGEFGLEGLEAFAAADSVGDLPEAAREQMREQAVFGSPEQVVEELSAYREALGDDAHFVLRTFVPGMDAADLDAGLRRLGEEVAPHLR
ncbi:MAG: LLM class flavin-dependent oxidoreductase [Haloarculaceae archaeon]